MTSISYILIKIIFQITGVLHNTGQSLVFRVDKDTKQHVNISNGPLAYKYQFEEIYIHYGTENNQGSEHQINGYTFPGEVSICDKNLSRLKLSFKLFHVFYTNPLTTFHQPKYFSKNII